MGHFKEVSEILWQYSNGIITAQQREELIRESIARHYSNIQTELELETVIDEKFRINVYKVNA